MEEQPTTIPAQVARLDLGVEALAQCVATLTQDSFVSTRGSWSPRDILAHLAGWNRHVIEGSRQIRKAELPFYDIDPGDDYSKVNAALVREYSSTEKQELLAELRASARELGQHLLALDPETWDRDYGVKHRGSTITIRNTVDELIEDYAHHTAQVEEWETRAPGQ